jgi:hypothetical protein
MKLQKGSQLTVFALNQDSVLLKTSNFKVNRGSFKYKFDPLPGKYILRFKAVAPDGTISEGSVIVISTGKGGKKTKSAKDIELANDSLLRVKALKNALADLAQGNLKSILNNLNLEKENITSEEDLLLYLKNQASNNKFSSALLDSLTNLSKNNQNASALKLISALKELSQGDLKKLLDSIEINNKTFKSPLEAIDYLITKSASNGASLNELLYITSILANPNDVYYYQKKLIEVTGGNLKEFLKATDLKKQNVSTPLDLMNYLLANARKKYYQPKDVFKAFFSIQYYTDDAKVLLKDLIEIAEGETKDFLKSIDLEKNNIKTVNDFGNYILNLAEKREVNPADILALIFAANEKHALEKIILGIKKYSTGNLNRFINKMKFPDKNIQTIKSLIDYLTEHAQEGGYSKEYLTKVLSQIASENLSRESIVTNKVQDKALGLSLIITLETILALIVIFFFVRRRNKKFDIS